MRVYFVCIYICGSGDDDDEFLAIQTEASQKLKKNY